MTDFGEIRPFKDGLCDVFGVVGESRQKNAGLGVVSGSAVVLEKLALPLRGQSAFKVQKQPEVEARV